MDTHYTAILLSMTQSQLRAFRRAYVILVRANVSQDTAINLLIEAHTCTLDRRNAYKRAS